MFRFFYAHNTKMSINVSLEDLPRLVFSDNVHDKKLALKLNNISDSKDLFQFLVDLLTKGIILLYGDGIPRVSLDRLGMVEISFLKRKLSNAGVDLMIDVKERDPNIMLGVVFIFDDTNTELKSYKMRITDMFKHIYIGFDLIW